MKLESDSILEEGSGQKDRTHGEFSFAEALNAEKLYCILAKEVGTNIKAYAGADAAASCWHQNFLTYANS